MNRLVLFAFLFTLLVLAVVGLEQEEQQSSLDRLPREAERPGKGSAEKKQKLKKKEKRKSKKKEKRLGRKLGDGKGKKGKKGKKGTKNPTKSKSKSKSKKNPKENNRHARMNTWATKASTCAVNATCLDNAMTYLKLMKDAVGNYMKQDARIRRANKTGGNKNGKKGLFAPTLRRIVKAGGGNKSDLQCNGVSNTTGANQLTNLTNTLLMCETTINASCNPVNFPTPNMTLVIECLSTIGSFKSMVEGCMKMNGSDACNCWSNSSFTNLTTSIRACKISNESKLMIKQLGYCRGNFSLCKTYEDDGLKAISACSESTEQLAAKAKSLTANSAGLTAAKDTSTSLTSSRMSSGRSVRAAATTCAEVIAANTKLTTLTDQNPSSPKIAALAKDVTDVTLTTACSDEEKTSLTTQVSELEASIASVSEELATVQADLETATGTTMSAAGIAAAEDTTEASSKRRNIVARHLMNRLNLN